MALAPNVVDRPRPGLWDRLDWKQRLVYLGSSSAFLASSVIFLLSAGNTIQTVQAASAGGAVPEQPAPAPTETLPVQKTKVATTTEWLQKRQGEADSAKAKELAQSIDFADEKHKSPAYGDILIPWGENQKDFAKEKTFSTILAFRRLGVEWAVLEDMIKFSYIGLIKNINIQVAPKKIEKRSLSFSEKWLVEIGVDDDQFLTLPHELTHDVLRIKTEEGKTAIGIMEASATWFQHYVNEHRPTSSGEFRGCGRVPGDYDYTAGFFDFDAANRWFYQKTGKFLLGTMINANHRWLTKGNEYSLPLPYLYQSIEDEFKIPKEETKSHLQGTPALKCTW